MANAIARAPDTALRELCGLIEKSRPELERFVRNVIWNKEDAEDITQSVLLKCFAKVDTFDARVGTNHELSIKVKNWMFAIARRSIIDFHRKESRRIKTVSISSLPVASYERVEPWYVPQSYAVVNLLVSLNEIVVAVDESGVRLFDGRYSNMERIRLWRLRRTYGALFETVK